MAENITSIPKICAPCHLPIEDTVHPKLAVVPEGHPCFVCGEKK